MGDGLTQARVHAERVQDQNLEQMADMLRELLAEDPDLLRELSALVRGTNTASAKTISRMPSNVIGAVMHYLIPAARIGWYQALFVMEDKYTPDQESPDAN